MKAIAKSTFFASKCLGILLGLQLFIALTSWAKDPINKVWNKSERAPFSLVDTICSGSFTYIDLRARGFEEGTTFTWVVEGHDDITGPAPCTGGCGSLIRQQLVHKGNNKLNRTISYTVTPISPRGTSGNDFLVNIIVKPAPNVSTGKFTGAAICAGERGKLFFDANDGSFATPYIIKYKIAGDSMIFEQQIETKNVDTFDVPLEVNPAVTTDFVLVSIQAGTLCERTVGFADSIATITVNPLPIIQTGSYGPICNNPSLVNLTGAPAGGIWSGMGVSGNTFDPAVSSQTIQYKYTDAKGCTDSVSTEINVSSSSSALMVAAGDYDPICFDSEPISLTKAMPEGGIWSGTGVNGNTFYPSVGSQTITYTVKDGNGCAVSDTTAIAVVNPVGNQIKDTICSGTATEVLLSSNIEGATFTWDVSATSNSVSGFETCNTGCGNTITQKLTNTSSSSATVKYLVTPISPGGCVGAEFAVDILVMPTPNNASGSFSASIICGSDSANLKYDAINSTFSKPYRVKYTDGTNLFEQIIPVDSAYYFSVPTLADSTITYKIISITNATCARVAGFADSVATISATGAVKVATGSYGPLCKNNPTINLSGMPVGGVWKGNGVSGNSFNPAAGTQLLTYVYTTPSGCADSATTEIVVKDVLAESVNAGSYSSICSTGNVQLAGMPAGGTWSGIGIEGNTFFGKNGTQSISYSVLDTNGCVSVSNTLIDVLPNPVGSANIKSVCSGSATEISLQSSLSQSSFVWATAVVSGGASGFTDCSGACGNQIIQTLHNNSSSSNATVRYEVVPISKNGCAGASFDVDVVVTPLPNVTSSGFKGNTICVGDTGQLSFDAVNSSFTSPYEIKYTNGLDTATQIISSADATQFKVANTLTETMNYTLLQIRNGVGCIRSASFGDSVATIRFAPPVVSANSYSDICSNGFSIDLKGSPAGGEWSGTGVTGTVFNPAVGSQTVTYTYVDGAGCKGVDTAFINVLPNDINPVKIEVVSNISCKDSVNGNIDLTAEFYSNNGKVIKSYKWYNSNNYDSIISANEDLMNVPPGRYLVEITAKDSATQCSKNYSQVVELGADVSKLSAQLSGTITVNQSAPVAPKISFSGSGGFMPYTFKYTVNGGAIKTIKGTPNAAIAQNTDSAGVFVYKLLSVQDSLGCSQNLNDSATITVKDNSKQEFTDLVPSLFVLPGIVRSQTYHIIKVDVYQIGSKPSSGKIILKLNKKYLHDFKFDSTASNLLGFFPVNNADWILEKDENSDYYIFSTTKSIPENGILSIGFETSFDVSSISANAVDVLAEIGDSSGGESNFSNNSSKSTLYILK